MEPLDYSFYDVLFLPGTMRHFIKYPDVGERFLLRISNAINDFPASVFYQCLQMLDPWNLAVASILQDAKQGLKTEEPPLAIDSLFTVVADLYLRSLFWFLYAAPTNYREWEAERLKGRRNSLHNINCLALGTNQGLVVGSDGVYGWGRSSLEMDNDQLPYRIELPLKICVVSVGCGTAHSICLTDRGELLGWGSNRYGQVRIDRMRRLRHRRNSPRKAKNGRKSAVSVKFDLKSVKFRDRFCENLVILANSAAIRQNLAFGRSLRLLGRCW